MADVLDLDAHRPHQQGEAWCPVCKETHHCVAPVGVVFMECPKCGAHKSVFRHPPEPADVSAVYKCNHCGGTVFQIFLRGPDCSQPDVRCVGLRGQRSRPLELTPGNCRASLVP